jgi:hypothetical protein
VTNTQETHMNVPLTDASNWSGATHPFATDQQKDEVLGHRPFVLEDGILEFGEKRMIAYLLRWWDPPDSPCFVYIRYPSASRAAYAAQAQSARSRGDVVGPLVAETLPATGDHRHPFVKFANWTPPARVAAGPTEQELDQLASAGDFGAEEPV